MSDFLDDLYLATLKKQEQKLISPEKYHKFKALEEESKIKLMSSLQRDDKNVLVGLVSALECVKEYECLEKFREGFYIGMRMAVDALSTRDKGKN